MTKLIVLEGADAGGKSTLGKYIAQQLDYVYWHNSGHPDMVTAQHQIQLKVLRNIEWNIQHKDTGFVLDRAWISDKIYGEIVRPKLHADLDFPYDLHEALIKSLGGVYVYCWDPGIVGRHERERNPEHTYDRSIFVEIVKSYNHFFKDREKEKTDVYRYNMEECGANMKAWLLENFS